jgi:hypothetical protein
MTAFPDRRNEALAGYTDLRDFAPPAPPICAEQAQWEAAELAEDARQRSERIAADVVAERARRRASCTVNWNRRFIEVGRPLARLLGEIRDEGFDSDDIREAMVRVNAGLRDIQAKQEAARGEPDHIGGNEG